MLLLWLRSTLFCTFLKYCKAEERFRTGGINATKRVGQQTRNNAVAPDSYADTP